MGWNKKWLNVGIVCGFKTANSKAYPHFTAKDEEKREQMHAHFYYLIVISLVIRKGTFQNVNFGGFVPLLS